MTPASAYSGSTVTIVGKNFPHPLPCTVAVGVSAATAAATDSCTIISSKFIAIKLSSSSSGSVNVYLFVNNDQFFLEASPRPLTILPAPSLSLMFPNRGYAGCFITISGSNFADGSSCIASLMLISSGMPSSTSSCAVMSVNRILLVIGTGASIGASSVTVNLASYPSTLTISTLTTFSLPSILSFTPQSAYSGCKITVMGSSFIDQDYSCVVFVGNPLASAVASSSCSIMSSNTIIFAVGNGSKVQANAMLQVAFNVAVRATSPANSFLAVVSPPGPGTIPALEIWYNADKSNTFNFNTAPGDGDGISQWTDRAMGQHNANTVGSAKPKWIANALNGYGVIRFIKASKLYLDLNPVSYLNDKSAFSIFFIARLLDFPATTGVQYLFSDSANGMRVFFNGSRWCVQATQSSGVGCSNVGGDNQFHVFSLMFDGTATGDTYITRFRFDFRDQPLAFATGSSQGSSTGVFARWQIGGEQANNSPNHLNGDVGEIVFFMRRLSQCEAVGVESYLRDHWVLPLEVLG